MRRLFASLALAAALVGAPAAHAEGVLLLVSGRTLDRAQMGVYTAALAPIYAANGGRYLGLGGPGRGVECLAGACAGRSAIVAQFPDAASLDRFWWGEDYRKAIRLRDRAGVFTVFSAPVLTAAPADPAGAGRLLLAVSAGAEAAGAALAAAAAGAGATVLVDAGGAALAPLEGDALWTHAVVAWFPSAAALEAFLASRPAKAAQRRLKGAHAHALYSVATLAPPPAKP